MAQPTKPYANRSYIAMSRYGALPIEAQLAFFCGDFNVSVTAYDVWLNIIK